MSTTEQLHREQGVDIDYRPFHPLAFVAVIMGILALLTFASFAMLVPAAIGIGTGWLAIRGCEGGARRSGHRLAAIGVFLASLGAAVGLTLYFGRIAVIRSVGRQHAEEIVSLLEKDYLEEVFSLNSHPLFRPDTGADQVAWYRQTEVLPEHKDSPAFEINAWLSLAPMAWMYEDKVAGKHEFVEQGYYQVIGAEERISCRYRYLPGDPETEPFLYDIELRRRIDPRLDGAHWMARIQGVIPEGTEEEPQMASIRSTQDPRTLFHRDYADDQATED